MIAETQYLLKGRDNTEDLIKNKILAFLIGISCNQVHSQELKSLETNLNWDHMCLCIKHFYVLWKPFCLKCICKDNLKDVYL